MKTKERMFLTELMGKRKFSYQSEIEKLQEQGFVVDVLEEMTEEEIRQIEETK